MEWTHTIWCVFTMSADTEGGDLGVGGEGVWDISYTSYLCYTSLHLPIPPYTSLYLLVPPYNSHISYTSYISCISYISYISPTYLPTYLPTRSPYDVLSQCPRTLPKHITSITQVETESTQVKKRMSEGLQAKLQFLGAIRCQTPIVCPMNDLESITIRCKVKFYILPNWKHS